MRTAPVRSVLAGTAATLVALFGLTGCTHASYDCSGQMCAIYLEGVGASIDIDADTLLGPGASGEITIELTGLATDGATFAVNGAEASCAPGVSQTVSDLQVTCQEVNEEGMSMEVTG